MNGERLIDYKSLTTEAKIGYLERLDFSKEIEGSLRNSMIQFAAGKLSAPIMLSALSCFLKTQARVGASTFPSSSPEVTTGFDLVAAALGYEPQESIVYRFKEVDHGFIGVLESVTEVPIPTLDFFSYSQGNRILYHVLLYGGLGDHYFKHPKNTYIFSPRNDSAFSGKPLDESKLVEPQLTLLKRETENLELKEIDKVDLTKTLVRKINTELEGLEISWEDFKYDFSSLMI
jgi:hypothetical protein